MQTISKTNLEGASKTARRSSLVGRDQEIAELSALVDRRWHVSIVGTAGIGKTRLANEALVRRGENCFVCDLTQAVHPDDVINAIARLLLVEPGEGSAIDRIAATLTAQGRACLLLDGVDRLSSDAWEKTIGVLLEACPELHVVVTARARLRVEGEAVFQLGPLDVTVPDGGLSPAEILFLQLAEGALGRDLREQGMVPRDVRELVRVLDGIPLALEIAASVLNVLSPYEFLKRSAVLLDAPAPAGSWSGGSLRAAFEVSWERLSIEAREALASLSVFVADFDLSAAEAVIGKTALQLLSLLCDASLVTSSQSGGRTRFRMFECVRHFASDHGDSASFLIVQNRHAHHYGIEATACVHRGELGQRRDSLDWVITEESNLVAVVTRALDSRAPLSDPELDAAVSALAGLAWMWRGRGPLEPRLPMLSRMDSHLRPGVLPDSLGVATLELALANTWRHRNKLERAAELVEDAVVRARRLALPYFEARCLLERARIARLRKDRELSITSLAEAVTIANGSKEDTLLQVMAILSRRLFSALDEDALKEASTLARNAEDPLALARVELAYGIHCYASGRPSEALEHLQLVAGASEKLRQRTWEAFAGIVSGNALAEQGRVNEARAMFENSLKIAVSTAHRRIEAEARGNLALLDFEAGRLSEAAEGLTTAIRLFSEKDPARLFFCAALSGVEATVPGRVGVAVERFLAAREDARRVAPALAKEIDRFGEMFHLTDGTENLLPSPEAMSSSAALGAARVARRVRESVHQRLARSALVIARDGRWFRPPLSAEVSLEARPVLRALLRELIEARLSLTSHFVTREDLVRAIWPDERSSRQSMGNRLSVAISTLRSLGLTAIVASPQGISLHDGVSIDDGSPTA